MSANSLSFRYEPDLYGSDNSIVILLPVWAYECEVHPPYERELDAYEDAVLRMVRINMGVNAIANALNASQSLIGTILSNLQDKGFAEKRKDHAWTITHDAQVYFDGYYEEKASEKAEYGFMFASALRKDVLPYYHSGSLDNVKLLFNGFEVKRNGNDQDTFTPFLPDNRVLGKAYSNYRKAVKAYNLQAEQKITPVEAAQIVEDLFADLDSMDEYDVQDVPMGADPAQAAAHAVDQQEKMKENLVVRRLNKPPRKRWLRLAVVFDPSVTNGFRVESPFDMRGIDNSWYLRQIQWMMNSDEILLNNEPIREFLVRESTKLGSARPVQEKDYTVYVIDKMPLLKTHKDLFPQIYENFRDIYGDIQKQSTLLDKENIVNQICTKVLEALYKRIFRSVDDNTVSIVQRRAKNEIESYGVREFRRRLFTICHLPADTLQRSKPDVVRKAADNLDWSRGNSILEKMYNLMLLYYYAPNDMIRRYVEMDDFQHCVESVCDLNLVRVSVAHDADYPFTAQSYTDFMNKVYPVANRMLRTIVGGN